MSVSAGVRMASRQDLGHPEGDVLSRRASTADLVDLNVWDHILLRPAGSVSVSERYVPDPSQTTSEALLRIITEELGEEPPVLVQPRVKQGRPAKVLIEDSADADLLVVGQRGHGGFAGLVLGSVSQHVAAYAKCPVTVVR